MRKYTSFIAGFLCAALIFGSVGYATELMTIGTRAVNLKINGRNVDTSKYPPLWIELPTESKTYVPIRLVAETLNMKVGFDDTTSTAIIENVTPGKFHGKVSYTVDGKTYPDDGAKVYLFPPTGDPIIRETTVSGNFDFGEIVGNEYTVLVVSGNAEGSARADVKAFLKDYAIPTGKAAIMSTVNLFENKSMNQEFVFTESDNAINITPHPISDSKDAVEARFTAKVYKTSRLTTLESPEPGAVVCLFPPPPSEKWTDSKSIIQMEVGEGGVGVLESVPANTYRLLTIAGTLEREDISGMMEPFDYDGREEAKALIFLGEYFKDPVAVRNELAGTKAVRVVDYTFNAYTDKNGFVGVGFLAIK